MYVYFVNFTVHSSKKEIFGNISNLNCEIFRGDVSVCVESCIEEQGVTLVQENKYFKSV